MAQPQRRTETPQLFKDLMQSYLDWRRQNMESLTPESVAQGFAGAPIGIAGRITPAVFKILAASGRRGLTTETPMLGTKLEQAILETNPSAMSRTRRTPIWAKLSEGKLQRGIPGVQHPEQAYQPGMLRAQEFPDYVALEQAKYMRPEEVPQMIELLQALNKPIAVPYLKEFGKYAGGLF